MTWMDSYYRVHMLYAEMMDCNQDVQDMVGDAAYILHTGRGLEPILWATSAWLALADYITGRHIHPDIDQDVYVGACRAIGLAVQGVIDYRMSIIDNNKEEYINGNKIDAGVN